MAITMSQSNQNETNRRSIPSRNRRVPSRLLSPEPGIINSPISTSIPTTQQSQSQAQSQPQPQLPSRSSNRSNAGVHSARQREEDMTEAFLGKRKRRPSTMKELPSSLTSRSESFSPPAPTTSNSNSNSTSTNQSISTNPPIRLKLRVSPLNNPHQSSSSPSSSSTKASLSTVSESPLTSSTTQSSTSRHTRHSRLSEPKSQPDQGAIPTPSSKSNLDTTPSYSHQESKNALGPSGGGFGGYDSDAGDATTALLRAQEPDYGSDMDVEDQEGARSCYNGNGAVDIRNARSRSRKTTSPAAFDSSSKSHPHSHSRTGPSRIKIKGHHKSTSLIGVKSKDHSLGNSPLSLGFPPSSSKSKSRAQSASAKDHRITFQSRDSRSHSHLAGRESGNRFTSSSSSAPFTTSGHEEMGMDILFEGGDDVQANERETLAPEEEESSEPEEDEEDDFHEAMLNGHDSDLEGGFSQPSRSEKAHFNGAGRLGYNRSKIHNSRDHHADRVEGSGSGSGSTTDIDTEDTPATTPRSPVSVGGELEWIITSPDHHVSKKGSDPTMSSTQQSSKSDLSSDIGASPSKSKPGLSDESSSTPPATRTRSALNTSKKQSLDKISLSIKPNSHAEQTSTPSEGSGGAVSVRKREAVFAHALPSPPRPRADAGKLFLSLPYDEAQMEGQRFDQDKRSGGRKSEAHLSREDGNERGANTASSKNASKGSHRSDLATRHHSSSFHGPNSSIAAANSKTTTPSRSAVHQESTSETSLNKQSQENTKGIASTSPLLSPSDSVRALHLHLNLGRPSSGLVGLSDGMPSPTLLTPGLHRTSSGSGIGIGVDVGMVLSPSILSSVRNLDEPEALNLGESKDDSGTRVENEKGEIDEVEEELIGTSTRSSRASSSASKPKLNSSTLKALQKGGASDLQTSQPRTQQFSTEEKLEAEEADEDDSHSSLSAGSDWLQNARSVSAELSPIRAECQHLHGEEDMLHQLGRPEDMPLSELDLAWGMDDQDSEMTKNIIGGNLSISAGTENLDRRSRFTGSDSSIIPQKRTNALLEGDDCEVPDGVSPNSKLTQRRSRKTSRRTKP